MFVLEQSMCIIGGHFSMIHSTGYIITSRWQQVLVIISESFELITQSIHSATLI